MWLILNVDKNLLNRERWLSSRWWLADFKSQRESESTKLHRCWWLNIVYYIYAHKTHICYLDSNKRFFLNCSCNHAIQFALIFPPYDGMLSHVDHKILRMNITQLYKKICSYGTIDHKGNNNFHFINISIEWNNCNRSYSNVIYAIICEYKEVDMWQLMIARFETDWKKKQGTILFSYQVT